MRGGNQPEVDGARLGVADPRDAALFDDTQECGLHRERHITELIQEKSRAMGSLDDPLAICDGSRIRTALGAKELACHERFRNGRAVERDHRQMRTGARVVKCARDHLFACASIAEHEHAELARTDLLYEAPKLVHRGVFADQQIIGLATRTGSPTELCEQWEYEGADHAEIVDLMFREARPHSALSQKYCAKDGSSEKHRNTEDRAELERCDAGHVPIAPMRRGIHQADGLSSCQHIAHERVREQCRAIFEHAPITVLGHRHRVVACMLEHERTGIRFGCSEELAEETAQCLRRIVGVTQCEREARNRKARARFERLGVRRDGPRDRRTVTFDGVAARDDEYIATIEKAQLEKTVVASFHDGPLRGQRWDAYIGARIRTHRRDALTNLGAERRHTGCWSDDDLDECFGSHLFPRADGAILLLCLLCCGAMTAVGRYELLEPIGAGGMAQVWLARSPDGDEVAVKLLLTARRGNPADLLRLERELRALERITHPHLIAVLDHGVDEERGPWLVMPLLRGLTMRDAFVGKRLCPEAALVILEPVIDALATIHEAGLVHRDVKPENVMLDPLGQVMLVDLGLALRDDDSRHTREGEVTGTLPYMSKERIEGRDVTPSADVWAVAVMLYELVTGARPFARQHAGEEVAAILAGAFVPLDVADPRVSPELRDLVAACLSPEPSSRPRDGRALLERVRRWLSDDAAEKKRARVSVMTDPAAFALRVAKNVAYEARQNALDAHRAGDNFGALKHLERALAYCPEDTALLALMDQMASGGAARIESTSEAVAIADEPTRHGRRWLVPLIAVLGLVLGLVPLGFFFSSSASDEGPIPAEPAPTSNADVHDAGVAVPLVFHRIPLRMLTNDDAPALNGLAADAGAPLVEGEIAHPEEAYRAATRSLEDDPTNLQLRIDEAMALLALGRTGEGLERVASLSSEGERSAEVGTLTGFVAMRQGHFDEADRVLTQALAVDPNHVSALRHRGVLRRRLGRTRDAYEDLVRVLELDPNNVYALAEICEVYEVAGRVADTLPFLDRLSEMNPLGVNIWVALSIARAAAGEVDAAESALERALSLEPSHPEALQMHCTLLSQHSRPDALRACDAAAAQLPTSADVFTARALEYARRRDSARALADADRAVELEPNESRHYANRAIIRGRLGNEAGAFADLRRACELGGRQSCERLRSAGVRP